MSDDLVRRLACPYPKDEDVEEVTLPVWVILLTTEAADRIEVLKAKLAAAEKERDEWRSLAEAAIKDDAAKNIHYAEIQAKLTAAMVGLVQSRDELDQYSQNEYPSDHPVHERYRQRDYDANPARIAIAKIKG